MASALLALFGMAGVATLSAVAGNDFGAPAAASRHVLVISVDGMGASWYAAPPAGLATPNLMRLKTEGSFAEIYLVPSGYGVLLQKIAETVFQITGKPAITLHFDRKTNSYWAIQLDIRAISNQA